MNDESAGDLKREPLQLEDYDHTLTQGIHITGTKDSLTIVLSDDVTYKDAKSRLLTEFKRSSTFYNGAVARIGFESHILKPTQIRGLTKLCQDHGVLFQPLPTDYKEQLKQANALMISRKLRSGQRIQYNGHIVIMGDVHPGAEVAAAGHVLVWGALKGTVHAGATGNTEAIICALEFDPLQLRIADYVAIPEEMEQHPNASAEIAFVKDKAIVAEAWNAKHFYQLGISLGS